VTNFGEWNRFGFKFANGDYTDQEFSDIDDDEAEIGTLFSDDGSVHLKKI
jgi:hypothetical protein